MGEYDIEKMSDDLSKQALTDWMAFYNLNPFGEDVQDMRFQALRSEIWYQSQMQCYTMRGVFGGSRAQPPRPRGLNEFQIFDRHGSAKKTKRTFLDMTQEEIAQSMRGMDSAWKEKYK